MLNNITKRGTILYDGYDKCCGCGACKQVCKKSAITMEEGELGCLYPNIDLNICVGCDACIKECGFKAQTERMPLAGYAVVNKNKDIVQDSSSGGAFTGIAELLMSNGYIVCGCELIINKNSTVEIKHTIARNSKEISKFRGSKYVQSNLEELYKELIKEFTLGNKVLFSGTPCQVSAVRSLFSKYSEQLITVDVICHGVSSQSLFNSYLDYNALSPKLIRFRDKKYGWTAKGTIKRADGSELEFNKNASSYYYYYYTGDIYRESCYKCPYASYTKRPADLTIGDFWGIKNAYPDLLSVNGGPLNKDEGISCVIVNSEKGKEIIESASDKCSIYPVDVRNIVKGNAQLQNSAIHSKLHKKIITLYQKKSYSKIEHLFQIHKRKVKIKSFIIRLLPKRVILLIKKQR